MCLGTRGLIASPLCCNLLFLRHPGIQSNVWDTPRARADQPLIDESATKTEDDPHPKSW